MDSSRPTEQPDKKRPTRPVRRDADTKVFLMGPGPREDAHRSREGFGWALTGALGSPLVVKTLDAYTDFGIELSTAHFVWLPPAVYVRVRAKHELHILGAVRRTAGVTYHGVLFVKEASHRRTVEDLAGANVGWVEPDSASGHLFPRLVLRENGISSDRFKPHFFGSHEAVVDAVAAGMCDVGATYASFREDGELDSAGWSEQHAPGELRVIAVSKPIPTDVLCATERGAASSTRLTTSLRALASHATGRALLTSIFGAHEFSDVRPTAYDVVRDALASVLEI